jgi:hypothetical protein
MQDALLVTRNVLWRVPGKNNKSRRRETLQHWISGCSALLLRGQGFAGTERRWTPLAIGMQGFLGESGVEG